jgi:hypothetical protein
MEEIGRVFRIPPGYNGVLVAYLRMEGWKIDDHHHDITNEGGEYAGTVYETDVDVRDSRLIQLLTYFEFD